MSLRRPANKSIYSKLVAATRAIIQDILVFLRNNFSPEVSPQQALPTLDLCLTAASKVKDNQALQFTGNQYFNCGNILFKSGKKNEARIFLEKSLELDFSPLAEAIDANEEEKKRLALYRCRKLEMLGECCVKGEEKVHLSKETVNRRMLLH